MVTNITLIRPFVHHAGDLATIRVSAWRAAYRGILSQPYLDGLDVVQETERASQSLSQSNETIFLALQDAVPAGYIVYTLAPTPDITALYVSPACQNKGIGKALVHHLLGCYPHEFHLWVIRQNHKAIRFYEAIGAKPTNQRRETRIGQDVVEEVRFTFQSH
jgi:ribosomal protein S18 acetylase RimI-like enzyme